MPAIIPAHAMICIALCAKLYRVDTALPAIQHTRQGSLRLAPNTYTYINNTYNGLIYDKGFIKYKHR